MWRTNTDGQKTLCNACGVRLHREQKKAKIARSGIDGTKAKSEPEVQLLPRSRSKSQSLIPEAKVGPSLCSFKSCRDFSHTTNPCGLLWPYDRRIRSISLCLEPLFRLSLSSRLRMMCSVEPRSSVQCKSAPWSKHCSLMAGGSVW